ncbi:hypothetical protein [Hymenobacter lapidarius]|uniref:hypothetical protein n=1 Tax=Hymenobacter lapidarius TaxID=1908237 RepID=UPI000F79CD15|nr:hypothetical protein [Hymenobacter lapidarius]
MKQFLLAVVLLSLICGSRTGWAQPNPKSEQNRCGSAFEIEKLKKYHPDIYQKWLRIEQHTQNYGLG